MGEPELLDKDDGDGGATTRIQVLEARAVLEELTEDATIQHRYEPKEPRVSWVQRLLNWFRRD